MQHKFYFYCFIFCVIFYEGVCVLPNEIASCPSKSGINVSSLSFDNLSRKWYMLVGVPAPGDPKVSKCVQLSIIKLSENSLSMRFTANSSKTYKPVIFEANATIVTSQNNSRTESENEIIGYWRLQVKNNTKILGPFEYILDHLNESYFAMAICPANSDTFPPTTKVVMILAREKNLSSQIINNIINSYSNYIPKELFEIVDHSFENCTLKELQ